MQTNVKIGLEFKQKLTNKHGDRFSDDVCTNLANAAVSKALRNAIFRVIPRSYVDSVEKEARRVAVGDQRTIADNRKRWLDWYGKAGISTERVLKMLGKPSVDDIGLADLETLSGTATSLREGHAKVDDIFPPEALQNGDHSFGKDGLKPEAKPGPASLDSVRIIQDYQPASKKVETPSQKKRGRGRPKKEKPQPETTRSEFTTDDPPPPSDEDRPGFGF
jgi:hypothetical protein